MVKERLEEANTKGDSIIKIDETFDEILDSWNILLSYNFLIISSIEMSFNHNKVALPATIVLSKRFLLDRITGNA